MYIFLFSRFYGKMAYISELYNVIVADLSVECIDNICNYTGT